MAGFIPPAFAADANAPTPEGQQPSESSSASASAAPATQAAPEDWAIHGQSTFTEQYHPAFRSPYSGPQSLNPGSRGDETFDITLYGGVRLWPGAEAWVDPEVNQGFGLSNTFGVAGFPSAESYKLGSEEPYIRVQRLFLRQTINLGGEDADGRSGPERAWRHAEREPRGADGWQVCLDGHVRHQQICP